MARDPFPPSRPLPPPGTPSFLRPWNLMLAALGVTVLGLLLMATPAIALRLITLGVGLLLAASAVVKRLKTAGWELEERFESAGLCAVASFTALLAYLGMEESWDSGKMFLGVLVGAGLVGAVLLVLPTMARRAVISLLVLFHFGGILTAVSCVQPRNDPSPWISMQLWTRFYRPYLTFAYLTNAYHFYSPDPGPPTLLWFRVEYSDRSHRWIKIPVRKDNLLALHYQRLLALTESSAAPMPRLPLSLAEVPQWERMTGRPYDRPTWNDIAHRRLVGAYKFSPDPILEIKDLAPAAQYSEPQELARRYISSYAHHIAVTSPHPTNPDVSVQSVSIYRLTHRIIGPGQIAQGMSPLDETFYTPFYMGKFNTKGELIDPNDPFLYWYLPIIMVPRNYPSGTDGIYINAPPPPDGRLLNCMKIHAGDWPEE
jgi:hypothetical protein